MDNSGFVHFGGVFPLYDVFPLHFLLNKNNISEISIQYNLEVCPWVGDKSAKTKCNSESMFFPELYGEFQ